MVSIYFDAILWPMLKTLLVNHLNPPGVDLFSGSGRCEPLNLAYLAGCLRQAGCPVEILDAEVLGCSANQVVKFIRKTQPDIVGLSAVTANFPVALKLARKVKQLKNPPQIVIGGCHVSARPAGITNHPEIDLAVIGEGEATLLELVQQLSQGKNNWQSIRGLAFRQGKQLVITPPRPLIQNLDTIHFPARDLLPSLSDYHPTPGMYRRLPMAFMITSRGCPFQCVFCSRTVFGNRYRHRSPQNVVNEMELLVKNFGVREIRVCDDIFNLNEARLLEICRLINHRRLRFSWGCSGRANLVTKKSLLALKRAGCWEICFGVESGSPAVLKTIKKGIVLADVRRAVRLARSCGLESRGFFMLGLPGDTEATMQQTIDFAKDLSLPMAQFYITTPYPGTELDQKAEKWGRIDRHSLNQYLSQTTTRPPFVPHGLTAQKINHYYKRALREYYLRPRFLLSRLLKIRDWTQFLANWRGFISIFRHARQN